MINSPITLPCGATLSNRIAKAATTERISNNIGFPQENIFNLYQKWSATGAGLLISGNVIFDPKHLESSGNVIPKNEEIIPSLKKWTQAGTKHGNHFWAQLSHAGRQTNILVNLRPKAPSVVQLKKMGLFGKPVEMTETDIEKVIEGFAKMAVLCQMGGFTGVQIHAAHGYLISQFLSPITNKRTDQWGGSLENRSRLLKLVIQKIRMALGQSFPIGVKLNSADFQRGGFTEEESLQVIKMLESEGVDLLEISGGTYEKLVFFHMNDEKEIRESTKKREAYFIDFAHKVRAISSLPLMITGGIRTYDFCNEVLSNNEVDVLGMARPFITNHQEIAQFLKGEIKNLADFAVRTGIHQLDDSAEGGYYAKQIIRLANNQPVKTNGSAINSALFLIRHEFTKAIGKKIFK